MDEGQVSNELASLRRELAVLRAELAEMRAIDLSASANASTAHLPTRRFSRRHLFAAGAGAVAATTLQPFPAAAAPGDAMTLGADNSAGSARTALASTNSTTLRVDGLSGDGAGIDASGGIALIARGSGPTGGQGIRATGEVAVEASSGEGVAILANSYGHSAVAIVANVDGRDSGTEGYAIAATGTRGAISAVALDGGGLVPAVKVRNDGTGPAILAESTQSTVGTEGIRVTTRGGSALVASNLNTGNQASAAYISTASAGPGLDVQCSHPSHAGFAVRSRSAGTGSAVDASSARGVGLKAQGGRAAIQLVPQSTAGVPTSGSHSRGELLVDKNGGLFFCITSGTPGTWKRVNLT